MASFNRIIYVQLEFSAAQPDNPKLEDTFSTAFPIIPGNVMLYKSFAGPNEKTQGVLTSSTRDNCFCERRPGIRPPDYRPALHERG